MTDTQKPRYKIGQTVWMPQISGDEKQIIMIEIEEIIINSVGVHYIPIDKQICDSQPEGNLFPTLEEAKNYLYKMIQGRIRLAKGNQRNET